MAKKKAVSSLRNGRDSNPKFLGIKASNQQYVNKGTIIVRQRGTKFTPGIGTSLGSDFTVYSTIAGTISFNRHCIHVT